MLQAPKAATNLRVNAERLWSRHMEIARIGAIEGDGSCRLAMTAEDAAARALFAGWCEKAGLAMSFDRAGNLNAVREGAEAGRPLVGSGSHLDTQPHGGRFDGVSGVLAALEEAAGKGARLVVFPETFLPWYPYFSFVLPPVLTGAEHLRLYEEAVVVPGPVTEAVAAGGSTLRDYARPDGERGAFQHGFRVYDRVGHACLTRGCTGRIGRIVQGGRSTFFCETCQVLPAG